MTLPAVIAAAAGFALTPEVIELRATNQDGTAIT